MGELAGNSGALLQGISETIDISKTEGLVDPVFLDLENSSRLARVAHPPEAPATPLVFPIGQ